MHTHEFRHTRSLSTKDRKIIVSQPRVLWLAKHACWTKQVKVYDLTSFHLPVGKGERKDYLLVKSQVEQLLKGVDGSGNSAVEPLWTFEKQGLFKHMLVFEGIPPAETLSGREGMRVAKWDQARWEWGTSRFHFPSESNSSSTVQALPPSQPGAGKSRGDHAYTYPSHIVTMKRSVTNPFDRSEFFVADSVRYEWRYDDIWTPRHISLFRHGPGGQIKVVARYRGQIPLTKAMGMILVDEEDLGDGTLFLVVATCAAMVRKDLKRQN